MIHIYNAATLASALASDLAPELRRLLLSRIAEIGDALMATTEWLIIEPGDDEADMISALGFTPLVEPIDGVRYPDFEQGGWDWIVDHGRYLEMQFSWGSSAALLLLIEDADGVIPQLLALCRRHASTRGQTSP